MHNYCSTLMQRVSSCRVSTANTIVSENYFFNDALIADLQPKKENANLSIVAGFCVVFDPR